MLATIATFMAISVWFQVIASITNVLSIYTWWYLQKKVTVTGYSLLICSLLILGWIVLINMFSNYKGHLKEKVDDHYWLYLKNIGLPWCIFFFHLFFEQKLYLTLGNTQIFVFRISRQSDDPVAPVEL